MNNLKTKKYKINGMHCVSCAMLIEGELEDSKVVDEACCNYATAELVVKSQKEVNEEKITDILSKLGYRIDAID
ncbi:heavy-metal-associated domain-containing protein [Patescibacteria group bacterium]|nr:heavy-metal-associated domain-containing protein [Patescibacteria group bacterium]MBU1970432.1 heavy-metal-associated domain-containing protein [Patescibacteria group bacterium]